MTIWRWPIPRSPRSGPQRCSTRFACWRRCRRARGFRPVWAKAAAGLSGGEARRLVLARAVLRRPRVLLLDEPTEGLDQATAARVLSGLRAALPEAAIVIAAHRPGEIAFADRRIRL